MLQELNKSKRWAGLHVADSSCFHYRRVRTTFITIAILAKLEYSNKGLTNLCKSCLGLWKYKVHNQHSLYNLVKFSMQLTANYLFIFLCFNEQRLMLRVLEPLKVKGSNANDDETEAHKIWMVPLCLSYYLFLLKTERLATENLFCNKCDRKSLIGTKSWLNVTWDERYEIIFDFQKKKNHIV